MKHTISRAKIAEICDFIKDPESTSGMDIVSVKIWACPGTAWVDIEAKKEGSDDHGNYTVIEDGVKQTFSAPCFSKEFPDKE